MDDPRVGQRLQPSPPPGPEPKPDPKDIAGFKAGKRPYIGQTIHFFPHRSLHPEWYFAPHAAIVIYIHPNDPRIVHLYFFGPKGEVGSYADIPHRSMRPECLPISNWLGHAMPPSTHWAFPGEDQ